MADKAYLYTSTIGERELFPKEYLNLIQVKVPQKYIEQINYDYIRQPLYVNHIGKWYYGRILYQKGRRYLVAFLDEEISMDTTVAKFFTVWVPESLCEFLGIIDDLSDYACTLDDNTYKLNPEKRKEAFKPENRKNFIVRDKYIEGFMENVNYKANTFAKLSYLSVEGKHLLAIIRYVVKDGNERALLDEKVIENMTNRYGEKYGLMEHTTIDETDDILYYEQIFIDLLKKSDLLNIKQ